MNSLQFKQYREMHILKHSSVSQCQRVCMTLLLHGEHPHFFSGINHIMQAAYQVHDLM